MDAAVHNSPDKEKPVRKNAEPGKGQCRQDFPIGHSVHERRAAAGAENNNRHGYHRPDEAMDNDFFWRNFVNLFEVDGN